LEGTDEVLDIGIEDYLYSDDVIIIEWAEKIKDILPRDRIDISIKTLLNSREVVINGNGKYFLNLKKELKENDCFRN
jgi:tRNA threonylcarbamoyladenosine biosynthesis protein TsaE